MAGSARAPPPVEMGKSAHEKALPALLRVYPPAEFEEFAEVSPEKGRGMAGRTPPAADAAVLLLQSSKPGLSGEPGTLGVTFSRWG